MARAPLAILVGLLISAPALAQPKPTPTPAPAGGEAPPPAEGGTEVEPVEDTSVADPSGMEENPDAPKSGVGGGLDAGGVADVGSGAPPPKQVTRKGFPIEEVARPITLPAMMSEAGLDLRNNIDPFIGNQTLRGRFGITRQIQIGLEYNIGGLYDQGDGTKFNTGKSIGLDVTYLIKDWLGARMALPFYLDPFAMGVTLGAPMKFRVTEKLAIGGFHDLLSITIKEFVPSTTNEAYNEFQAMNVGTGSSLPAGNFRLSAYALFQQSPKLAIGGELAITLEDFKDSDIPYSLLGKLQYSISNKLDFGALAGFNDLSDASKSITVNVYGQVRI